MSIQRTNRFWSTSLELTLFFKILKLFVKIHLTVSFAGKKKIIFFGSMDQKLWMFEVLKRSMNRWACAGAN